MIVDSGREAIVDFIKKTFTKARVGLGGNSTSPTSTNLDVPVVDVSSTTNSLSDVNVIELKFTIAGSSVSGLVLREIGIFNASYTDSLGNTISDYEQMLTRLNFDGIGPFSSGDLDFYVVLEVE